MGLALGLACSLLIMLWVNEEYKVDAFHNNGSRLVSVFEKQYHEGGVNAFHGGPGIMADEMKRVLPDIQYATNYGWNELCTFEANNKILKQNGNHAGFLKCLPILCCRAIPQQPSITWILSSPKDGR
jgi:hypothetical protein